MTRILALAVILAGVTASAASSGGRVIGGTPIQIQAAPWAVFVASDTAKFEIDCSGSVIDATHVLTAAHCLFDSTGALAQASAITVTAGVSNFQTPDSTRQQRPVLSFRIHPGYVQTSQGSPDDVAVLQLAAPLDLSGPAVQAVALPAANAVFPGQVAVSVAGFGLEDGAASSATGALESTTGTVEWQGGCGDFTSSDIIVFDNGVTLCEVSPSTSLCHGDSGAGIVTTTGTPMLVGVADAVEQGCPVGKDSIAAYVGAPEILSFIQGNDSPPTAPRASSATTTQLTWGRPLVVGDTLTCITAGWPGPVQLSYAFLDGSNATVLQNGSNAHYLVRAADAGRTISCQAAATNSGGTTVSYTDATPKIGPPPQVRIARLAALAAKRGQTVSLRVVLQSAAGLSGTFTVCAALPASVGTHACVSRKEPFGASGSFRFAVPLKIRPKARLGAARVTITAVAGTSKAKATATVRVRA